MFTLRIENGGERDVRECERYTVKYESGERVVRLLDITGLMLANGYIKLDPQASLYVMNAQGKTVDIIRPTAVSNRSAVMRHT